MTNLRSTAGRILRSGNPTPMEARQLAASVLNEEPDVPVTKTKQELQRLAQKLVGVEGAGERLSLINKQIESM